MDVQRVEACSIFNDLVEQDMDIQIVKGLDQDQDIVISKETKELKNELKMKSVSRTFLPLYEDGRVSLTRIINIVLVGHLTPADLSILDGFPELNEQIDIVNKGFVTLGKAIDFSGRKVILRDTTLLAPMGAKSLASIGKLYNLDKLELSKEEIQNMDILLRTDRNKFIEYAIRDALITLTHANWMEEFNFELGCVGVPLTLSSLGNKYVLSKWNSVKYKGYQITPDYLIGDSPRVQTPLGLQALGDVGLILDLFIKNYKGGRNESLMYGISGEKFYDYDLTSAYTTVLYQLGQPDYANIVKLTEDELLQLSDEDLLYSYTIIKCQFNFPGNVKFPSIPVYVDETTTVYPLNGSAVITGAEYILARNQGCSINKLEIYQISYQPK